MSSEPSVATPGPRLSTPALAGTLTAVSGVLLALLVWAIVLLVRASTAHKRLLGDLEKRGIHVNKAPGQLDPTEPGTPKSQTLPKRPRLQQCSKGSGWGILASREEEPRSAQDGRWPRWSANILHRRPSGFPWPFKMKEPIISPPPVRLTTLKGRQLSEIIEKPCVLPETPPRNARPTEISRRNSSPPPSHHGLSPHAHPDRNSLSKDIEVREIGLDSSPPLPPVPLFSNTPASPSEELHQLRRETRSKSLAGDSLSGKGSISRIPRLQTHIRSVSLTSQNAGEVPAEPVPPLPLSVTKLKEEERALSGRLNRLSRNSISSIESAGSSILGGTSPLAFRSNSIQPKSMSRQEWLNSFNVASRSAERFGPTQNHSTHPPKGSHYSSPIRFGTNSDISELGRNENINNGLELASGFRSNRLSTPLTIRSTYSRSLSTPRRQPKSRVTLYGSPRERRPSSALARGALRDVSGNQPCPTRQDSQNSSQSQASSTRSSNGNPFQWDPTPLLSGKPSAMKGSPHARKGHRRQNCVRISLAPTILGPHTRSGTPSTIQDIEEESSESNFQDIEIGISDQRPSPQVLRPPSTSIFAPQVRLRPTVLTASLTMDSPTLSMANYESHNYSSAGSSPLRTCSARMSGISDDSVFSISCFPAPGTGQHRLEAETPCLSLTRPADDTNRESTTLDDISPTEEPQGALDSPPQILTQPFRLAEPDASPFVAECPIMQSIPSSPPTTTPESRHVFTSPVSSRPSSDSPPCSPRTVRPRSFIPAPSTIDPILLTYFGSSSTTTQPGLSTAVGTSTEQPRAYSTPSAPVSDFMAENVGASPPSSPRPHTRALPNLQGIAGSGIRGPRPAPGNPLRRTIVALRRMNSEASVRKDRRYLRLGREASPSSSGWGSSWTSLDTESDNVTDLDIQLGPQMEIQGVLVESAMQGLTGEIASGNDSTPDDIQPCESETILESIESDLEQKGCFVDESASHLYDSLILTDRSSTSTIIPDEADLFAFPGMGCFALALQEPLTPAAEPESGEDRQADPFQPNTTLNVWEDDKTFWTSDAQSQGLSGDDGDAVISDSHPLIAASMPTECSDSNKENARVQAEHSSPACGESGLPTTPSPSNVTSKAKKSRLRKEQNRTPSSSSSKKKAKTTPNKITKRKASVSANTTPTKNKKPNSKTTSPSPASKVSEPGENGPTSKHWRSLSRGSSEALGGAERSAGGTMESGLVLGGENAGFETPAFRVNVVPPGVTARNSWDKKMGWNEGETPGSLYDQEGFLRI